MKLYSVLLLIMGSMSMTLCLAGDGFFDTFFEESPLFDDQFFVEMQNRMAALDRDMKQMHERIARRIKTAEKEPLALNTTPAARMGVQTEETGDAFRIKLAVAPEVKRGDIKVEMRTGKLLVSIPGNPTVDMVVTPSRLAVQSHGGARKEKDEGGEQELYAAQEIISQHAMSLPVRLNLVQDPEITLHNGELTLTCALEKVRTLEVRDVSGDLKKGAKLPAVQQDSVQKDQDAK